MRVWTCERLPESSSRGCSGEETGYLPVEVAVGMHIPLLGEVTALRAFFLFLFFYSNDSSSLGTWSTFGAGMLLSDLADKIKPDKPNMTSVALSAAVTFGVLGYASLYLEQMRMMMFLSLQSLWVPTVKHKFCRVSVEASAEQPAVGGEATQKMEFSAKRVLPSLGGLMVSLYVWDGLSGLTSGTLFLIVLPEVTARLPPFPSWKTVLFYLTLVLVSAPIAAIVIGATNFEKEMMELPEGYKNAAKSVLGAQPESVPDYYAVIGVRRGAESSEIKKVPHLSHTLSWAEFSDPPDSFDAQNRPAGRCVDIEARECTVS